MMKYLLLTACLLAGIIACNDDTKVCDVDVRTPVRVHFTDTLPNGISKDTTMPKVTLYALGKDSIYRKQTGLNGLQFTLDRTADSSRYYFQTDSTRIADTLTFRYHRQPHFISAGCGVVMYFNLDTVFSTNNVVTGVQVNKSQVTTGNETHIILLF